MTRRIVMALAGAVIGLAVLLFAGYCLLSVMLWDLPDKYAAMNVGFALAERLRAPDGDWPTSWEEMDPSLLDELETSYPGFRDRVFVRWDVSSEELESVQSADQPPFPLVWLAGGGIPGPTKGHDANEVIFRTLVDRRQERSGGDDETGDSD